MISVLDIIAHGDKYKRIIKIADGWVRKKLGASVEDVEKDLSNTGNPIFSRLFNLINATKDEIKEPYQARMIDNYGKLILWGMLRDSGYEDVFVRMLHKAMNDESLRKEINMQVKKAEDLNCNVWHDTKEDTKNQKKAGKIDAISKSESEEIYIPPAQHKKLAKY